MTYRNKKIIEWVIFSFLGLLLIISGSLFAYQQVYAGKIYKNVNVAGVDLSGKSRKQATYLLQKKFDSLSNSDIVFKTNDKEVKTKVSDTGLTLNIDRIVAEAYRIGRNENFFKQASSSASTLWQKNNVKVEANIDQVKYENFKNIALAQLNSEPQDAKITIENGEIKQVAEKDGQVVNLDNLAEKLLAITSNQLKIIELEAKPSAPKIKLVSFEPARAYAQTVLNKKFTFVYENESFSPTKTEIGLWISFNAEEDQYSATLNESNIQAYLNKIGKKFEIVKADRKINAVDGSVIEEGREGRSLDKNDAIGQIKKQIDSSDNIAVNLRTNPVPPKEIKIFPAEGIVAGRFEGRYVDISLPEQKLCRIEGSNIIECYKVSSGKPGMDTPTGTFNINEKNPRKWSNKYGMWLPWWQQFKSGGWGLHELPEWPNGYKEGENHLGIPVSHGCVRLGVGPAQTLYDWTSIGTPVYIHK